jgi:DNA polymerase I
VIFDIETDGFLDTMTRVHSLVLRELETGRVWSLHNQHDTGSAENVADGLKMLMAADLIVGHNIIKFDIPAIRKVYPWFTVDPRKVFDTLTISRLIWTQLAEQDMAKIRAAKTTMTPDLAGWHSLEAWGHRLGEWKGDYAKMMEAQGLDPWAEWNQEMQDYCEQDVVVNELLYRKILEKAYDDRAIRLELDLAFIMAQMERNGFGFDVPAAERLYVELAGKREELSQELRDLFPPWYVRDGKTRTPKKPHRTLGYWGEKTATGFNGYPFTKIKLNVFNPNSRDQISDRLMRVRGWKPTVMTPGGKPKVDDEVLGELKYPEAKRLSDYMLLQKRIGQLAEGDNAWLKLVKQGRIYGSINQNGAVTGRATHSKPNIAQVPAVGTLYGAECRALFYAATRGRVQLGCDVSGLELRMLGHFMAKHDGGAYANEVINGDVHSTNAAALFGMDPEEFKVRRKSEDPIESIIEQVQEAYEWLRKLPEEKRKGNLVKSFYESLRNTAKTFIYAFLYGAGDGKIGSIVGKGRQAGKRLKEKFFKRFPALKKLIEGVQANAEARGYLKGLDGRLLHVRSAHSALNTLLQSAGAIVCKQWIVEFDKLLRERGLHNVVSIVAWVHDELQMEVVAEYADEVGKLCVEAIERAGVMLGIRVPLTGEFKIGKNWKDCH